MDFSQLFEGPAVLAKKLEVRWFHNDAVVDIPTTNRKEKPLTIICETPSALKHQMPFLRRSLFYIRDEAALLSSEETIIKQNKQPRLVRHILAAKTTRESKSYLSKVDLLSKVFNRRSRRSNQSPTLLTIATEGKMGESSVNDILVKPCATPTAECTAFDKTSSSYVPYDSGQWFKPKEPQDAFALFCASIPDNAQKEHFSGNPMSDDANNSHENLKVMWDSLSQTDHMYWRQEEICDQERYIHENMDYSRARRDVGHPCVPPVCLLQETNDLNRPTAAAKVLSEKAKSGRCAISKQSFYSSIYKDLSKVFYYYCYIGDDNLVSVQVEMRRDRRCPFCFFDAASDTGLVAHCRSTHSETLTFDVGRDEAGNLHVAVKSNLLRALSVSGPPEKFCDFIFVKSKRNIESIRFVKKPLQEIIALDSVARKKKLRHLESVGADSDATSQYVLNDNVPVRQYYHSRTNLPMLEGDWDYDSDNEPDDTWLHRMSEELMDEFGDVSSKEKLFMKSWNRFMKRHTLVADKGMFEICVTFVVGHWQEMLSSGLRQNLLMHLFNLWDNSVISSTHILYVMRLYDDAAKSYFGNPVTTDPYIASDKSSERDGLATTAPGQKRRGKRERPEKPSTALTLYLSTKKQRRHSNVVSRTFPKVSI